ncbi:hypothetical protein [Cedecea davisae]|uniref:hypothetical protein n=1 Tax=Cedecea davisae TaxID=158484 RepID=UPI0024311021|nr:hypothetical protein [Cedecea davisae]
MGSVAMLAGVGWGGRYFFSSHSESSFTDENRTAASEVYISNNESLQHAGVSEKLVGHFGSREPSVGERINIHARRHIIYEQVTLKPEEIESIAENEDIELYENGMVCSEPLSLNEERAESKSKQSCYYHSKSKLPYNSLKKFHLQCQQAYNDAEKEDRDKTCASMNLNTRKGWCSCPPRNMLNAIINKSTTRKPSTTTEEYNTPAFSILKNVNKRMPLKFIYVEPEPISNRAKLYNLLRLKYRMTLR